MLASDLRSKMLTAAEAVRPGGEALRVPVRVDTLPASLPSLKAAQEVRLLDWDGNWQWLSLDDAIQIHATAETGSVVCEADDGSLPQGQLHLPRAPRLSRGRRANRPQP